MSEQTIQIEVILEGGFLHEGVKYTKGDVSTEPLDLGEYFCRAGWAKDTTGTVTTGTPALNETVLLVQDVAESNTLGVL